MADSDAVPDSWRAALEPVLALPASSEMIAFRPDDLAAFERVHRSTWRVWMAGPASYITSLLLNIWIFDRLRGSGAETTLGLMVRGAIASALSQAVDSVIFITLAFYGEFDITDLMIGQVLAKVFLSLVLVPFLITGGVQAARPCAPRHSAASGGGTSPRRSSTTKSLPAPCILVKRIAVARGYGDSAIPVGGRHRSRIDRRLGGDAVGRRRCRLGRRHRRFFHRLLRHEQRALGTAGGQDRHQGGSEDKTGVPVHAASIATAR